MRSDMTFCGHKKIKQKQRVWMAQALETDIRMSIPWELILKESGAGRIDLGLGSLTEWPMTIAVK